MQRVVALYNLWHFDSSIIETILIHKHRTFDPSVPEQIRAPNTRVTASGCPLQKISEMGKEAFHLKAAKYEELVH